MSNTRVTHLDERIERIAAIHGLNLSTFTNSFGSVFTTPDWTDWPDEMIAEVKLIADRRMGPDADYWESRTERTNLIATLRTDHPYYCAYCDAEVSSLDVPEVDDDEEWEKAAREHAPGCEWVRTRAHWL